mgnify:CR=1 FL=1
MVVFLLEEKSMELFLRGILPNIMKAEDYKLISHEGKGDLMKSIPIMLKAWNLPNTQFFIVHDQDSNDCMELKQKIADICRPYNKDVTIRIVCRELESWYFGDIGAVEKAYAKDLGKLRNSRKYAIPDEIRHPKAILKQFIPELTQIDGARRISSLINVDNNKSHSFKVFWESVKRFSK